MKVNNPFIITSKYVSKEYFCDREKESAELVGNIRNWRNTVLVSQRRMGKSGLIGHVFSTPEISKEYETFFIDIYDTTSLDDFVLLLGKEICERLQSRGEKLVEKFLMTVSSVVASFSADPISGMPSIDLKPSATSSAGKSLEQIFKFLESSSRPCVVAIDEFQQIADYRDGKKIIATLRKLVQNCQNTCFIFAGSNRRMMGQLFNTPSEPFFMSCTPLYLDAIALDKYTDFVSGHFKNNGKKIEKKCIETVYNLFDGHTWYMQYVFNRIFEITDAGQTANLQLIETAISNIFDIFGHVFQEMLLRVSEKQKALLIAVAKENKVKNITGAQFISSYNLKTASAIQGALRPLIENETITKEVDCYRITNRFFSLWIAKRY
ncbi:MAG: ATP-binding protein [Bacteroidales bacterium]|nr:ATP-binding protein [Bacteroidales bacterium]